MAGAMFGRPEPLPPRTAAARRSRLRLAAGAAACVWLLSAADAAQAGPALDLSSATAGAPLGAALPVDIKADAMDYDRQRGVVTAQGHVVISRTNETLKADWVQLDVNRHLAQARGHVVFTRGTSKWSGESFTYNFVTKEWSTGPFQAYVDPFFVNARSAEQISSVEYCLHDAVMTTCSNKVDAYHYKAKAKTVYIIPGNRMKAYHVTTYLGYLPVLYSPVWYHDLDDRSLGLYLRPGYRSSYGVYLLTAYRFQITTNLKATTHLDWRYSRGWAGGQDLTWQNLFGEGSGGLYTYYARDQGVWKQHEGAEASLVDEDRYRLRLKHTQTLGSRDYILSEFNYLSDYYVIEDFYRSEYAQHNQPENYASYTYRADKFTVGLLARVRLNDYYSVVNRLPEATFDVSRRQIGTSSFYYQSSTAASFLQKVYAATSESEDYSAFRFDSSHYVYYSTRQFGFLNIIPRVGYRGTYYSATAETLQETTVATVVTTNYVASGGGSNAVVSTETQTNTASQTISGPGKYRSLVEVGVEVSFKAFRTWDTATNSWLNGFRHIIEPYANYTFVPEPDVKPAELYQFDSVDALDKQNSVKVGLRNKLQTKRSGRPSTLVDLDVYTTYSFDPDTVDPLGDFVGKLKITPVINFRWDVEAEYDPNTQRLDTFSTRLLWVKTYWRTGLEYRYRDRTTALWSPTLNLTPNKNWTIEAYAYYDAEGERLMEHGYYVQRNFDCLAVRAGFLHNPAYTTKAGVHRKDEYEVEVALWLTAFPQAPMGETRSHTVTIP
jgi:lipopolysaccharide assembly outer membrane protein LptD (OstA)